MVPVVAVDHASMEAVTVPPTISAPVSATRPAVPPELETPPTISPNTLSSMPLFQGAHSVYMSHPTITVVNNGFSAGENERTRPQILVSMYNL
ncbi:hypothetical protein BYT27DRAFT_6835601 [Phlegmacium glaucopus]|nr:hypothetical protein BYT27DRAFT_6835601 [Phlegmacium glaucopus]